MNIVTNRGIPTRKLSDDMPKSLRFEDDTTATELTGSVSTHLGSHEGQAREGSRAVVMLKILVIFILVQAAFVVSFLTYYFIVTDQSEDFDTQFEDYASKLMEQFLEVSHLKVWTCYSLSLAFTTEFENSDAWPNVALSRFAVRTYGSTSMVRASSVAFAPMVTDETRDAWEAYAADSNIVAQLNETLAATAISRKGHRVRELAAEATRSIEDGIFRMENETIVDDKGPGPYFPVWQVSPVTENTQAIMYNQMSDPARSRAISVMMEDTCPVWSQVFYQDAYAQEKDEAYFETRGILYFPVFDSFSNGGVVGAASVEFNWEDNFRNVLPAHAQGIDVVLESTCDQMFTYRVQGEHVEFTGTGDLHDTQYDEMEESTSYNDFLKTFSGAAMFSVDAEGLAHKNSSVKQH